MLLIPAIDLKDGHCVRLTQGDMDQAQRIAEFDRFKSDEVNILVASDVAARGLDVKGVSHVINFDVPWQPDDYIHRIGRTGRAGAKGIAITLATKADSEAVASIEKLSGQKIARAGKAEPRKAPEKSELQVEADTRGSAAPKKSPAKRDASRESKPRTEPRHEPRDRTPVVEDISNDWNGPLPSFLSKGVD
jgi:superfamily II DNA/RNA helicase